MARFEVSFSEMYNAANRIHQAAEEYLSTACKVYACAEVLGASWVGESQVAFMEEQRKAVEWFKKMAALVESYVQMIQQAAKAYQEAEERAAQAIKDAGTGGIGGMVDIGIHNWESIQTPIAVTLYGAPNVVLNPSQFINFT